MDVDSALKRYSSEETEWHWRFRVFKAEILAHQNSSIEALALLRKEPPPAFAEADFAVRRKIVQGVASAWVRQANDSLRFLEDAETLARTSHPELLGEVALAKGAVCFLASDLSCAAKAYRDAFQVAQRQNDLYVESLGLAGLGAVATREERYDESVDWQQAALGLAQSLDAQGSLAQILGNIAWNYRRLGDFDNALEFYKRAEEASAKIKVPALQIYWLTGISNVYYLQRDYEGARAALENGLSMARSQGNRRTLIEYLNDLAETELETGRPDDAENHYEEVAHLEEGGPDKTEIIATQLVHGRIELGKSLYAEAEKSFRGIIEDPKADTSQHWEAEARLAQVYAAEGRTAQAETEFRHSLGTIETARSSVHAENLRLSFLSVAISFYDDYIEFLISQRRMNDALRVAELSRARTLEEGLSSTVKAPSSSRLLVQPEQLAQKLKVTLLFYWMGHDQSHLWVITPAKTAYFTLPKAAEIEPVVKSYQKTVLGMRDAQDAGSGDGKRLYEMLVEPARKLIPQGSRVIVLPDESLYGLNYETLVVPDPQPHFWIEDVTLTTASSLTLLERSAASSVTSEKSLLLVGNTEQPNQDFPPLPQAPAEMQKIERYFPDARRQVLEGKQATPSAYLSSNPERFAYLHFVTHGTASHTRPLESAVILSKEGDSYKLYARDIVQHHLNASLVTISACNGSGTRAYSGEGLVGLSWAFLRAGAHNVIGALWEVSDASTPQLMDTLYGELSEGKDPATALRDAKLSLLHSSDPHSVFKKPFYWAPFQLYAGS